MTNGPVEPSADIRTMASFLFQTFGTNTDMAMFDEAILTDVNAQLAAGDLIIEMVYEPLEFPETLTAPRHRRVTPTLREPTPDERRSGIVMIYRTENA